MRADVAFGNDRWLTVAPAGSAVDFTLFSPVRSSPGWQQGLVLHTDDIDGVIAALREAGVEVADAQRQGWGIQTQFADPDGNGFVLLQQG